ncbi:MAG: hypothetical protein ACT6TH_06865 [Brevundimonas sp.]|uniref:hypothetical protein n=1 Tax=Brevundimonas sp. TaxID=1871086 RepID=UPI00403450B6
MRARIIPCAVAAGGALASACATAVPPSPAVLEYSRAGCPATPDLSTAISLTPKKETNGHIVTTVIGPESGCLQMGETSSPYALYALPSDIDDKTLSVGGVLEVLRILSPTVSVLGTDGAVRRTFAAEDYFYRGPVYSVQFRPEPGDAYVLVTTNPARVGQRYDSINVGTSTTAVYTGYGTANFTTGHEVNGSRAFSYEGAVQIIVYDSDTREEGRSGS